MRTRSQARRRRQPQVRQTSVESSNLEKPDNPPIVTLADNRYMALLLDSANRGELEELLEFSAMIDSHLENIYHSQLVITPPASPEHLLNDFIDLQDFLKVYDLKFDVESDDTPLVSHFLASDEESDDGEVINDMNECENTSYYDMVGRFNTIITSLKALDEGFSSKSYVRKFLKAFNPKWHTKVTAIEESKDLTSLSLANLLANEK
ncbi:hypothetical protein Tco_0196005 [Tanacetum coccineum]